MKIVFFGCTKYSEKILQTLIKLDDLEISAIFSIPEFFHISYSKEKIKNSNYAALKIYSKQLGCEYYEIDSVKGKKTIDYFEVIKNIEPDVILVLGWYYNVPLKVRELSKHGAWGIHASLLPNYAGGAPLVWAIIEGEKETGVTLFRLSDGVDDGDIIAQSKIIIEETDTIKDVYNKATLASECILIGALKDPANIVYKKQDVSKINIYPQRSPKDGEIDWTWEEKRIKDFIRAQTRPYPGAWTIINGKKITIWSADIEKF